MSENTVRVFNASAYSQIVDGAGAVPPYWIVEAAETEATRKLMEIGILREVENEKPTQRGSEKNTTRKVKGKP